MSDDYKTQYARSLRGLPEPHPDIAHTALAHVLTKLATTDKHATDAVKGMAAASLERPELTPILADALEESGHPLADAYNWRGVPRGLEIHRRLRETAAKVAEEFNAERADSFNGRDRPYTPTTADDVVYHATHDASIGGVVWRRRLGLRLPDDVSYEEYVGTLRRLSHQRVNRHLEQSNDGIRRERRNWGSHTYPYSTHPATWKRAATRTRESLMRSYGINRLHPDDHADRFFDVRAT